jgi:4-hydroxy-3-methylbut-2-enyl diphosphate reductase
MQIGKKDGFIDKADAEVDGSYDPANYKKGDSISAIYTGESNKDYILLSKKEVDLKVLEDAEAEKALADGEFDLTISEVVKGGLRGRLGSYTVFVPASHVKMGYVKNLEDYKGKTLHVVQLTEENAEGEDEKASKKRFIVASAKKYLEREKQAKEDEFWNNIHIHDIVTGKVKRFTQFGAFVSVKGFDCLAHISELSWNKITDPSTVLTIGESYDFVVLKMDRATGKISLGYKQLQKKPYEAAAERFPVGTVIKGKVERIFSYGAFISICEGVDGLVHVSQISHNWIKDANEILKVGEEVEAKIIGFEENRITLSIKELLPAPEVAEEAPAAEAEAEATEKPKKNARIKKFEEKVAEGEEKRERRPRKAAAETSAEPKEFISGSSSASLGDLFKGLMLDLEAEEAAEEAPKKKATRKKKTEDAE